MAETNKGEIKMKKVKCDHCKEEVRVSLYFYGALITMEEDAVYQSKEYRAVVNGKAICPYCGSEINKTFSKCINTGDIIDLAGG
jgi:hypothetical protein